MPGASAATAAPASNVGAGISIDASGGVVSGQVQPGNNAAISNLLTSGMAPAAAPQAVLSSSTPARSATAANVTKLQTVTAPSASNPSATSTGVQDGPNLPPAASSSSTTSTGGLTSDQLSAAGVKDVTGWTQTPGPNGTTLFSPPASSATPGATAGSSGSSSADSDPYSAAVAGITDPGLAAQFKTSLQNIDSEISTAQSNIASVQARSLNDPAVTSIVSSIQAKYQQQIDLMKARNAQVIGQANTSVAAFGGLGTMSGSFLNNEQSQADERIQNLQDEEDSAIAQAQAAYLSQNAKDLNTAMTAYDDANKEKLTELGNLLTASGKQVSATQAQQKIDLQAQKDALASDVTTSTKIAAGVASNIKASGLTDPAQIKDYVAGIAAQYGISNPDILYSQVVSAGQTLDKNALGLTNTQNEIDTRTSNANNSSVRTDIAADKAANPTQSASEKKQSALDNLSTIITTNNGGNPLPNTDGVPVVDKNGFITPEALKAALSSAPSEGLTEADVLTAVQPYLAKNSDGSVMSTYGLNAALTKLVNPSS